MTRTRGSFSDLVRTPGPYGARLRDGGRRALLGAYGFVLHRECGIRPLA